MKLSMKRIFSIVSIFVLCFFLAGCRKDAKPADTDNKAENKVASEVAKDEKDDEDKKEDGTKLIVDSLKREVTVPKEVKKIVCVGVGTLRYTCYMDSEDLVVGVEDHEKKEPVLARPYNYVNFDKFKDLPGIGDNGEPNIEKIIELEPDVILAIDSLKIGVDELQEKTNIPVVSIPIAAIYKNYVLNKDL